MNTALTIIRNSTFSFLASLITKVANTLVFILVARQLVVDEVGVYSLALTYNIIFVQIASWGLDQLLVREVARRRVESGQYLVNFLLLRILISFLTYGLLVFVVTVAIHYAQFTVHLLLLAGLTIIFDSISNICQAVFIAFEQLAYITYASLVTSLFKLGATWIGLQATGGVALLVGVVVGVSLIGMLFNLILVRWRFLSAPFSGDSQEKLFKLKAWPNWLRIAFPFVFITLFYTLDYRLDVVLLSVWHGEAAVGIYGAAITVLFALLFIAQAFREAIFPAMSRFYPTNKVALDQIYSTAARWLLAIALPLALGITLLAGDLMPLIYQESFRESGRVLQIIVWSILFLFLNVPSARLMIVAGKQRAVAWFSVISLSVNLLLNLLLIPDQSYMGAAWARLISAALFFSLIYLYAYYYLVRFNLLSIMLRPILATIVMGGVMSMTREFPLPLIIIGAIVSYGLTLWGLGFVSKDERIFIRRMLVRA